MSAKKTLTKALEILEERGRTTGTLINTLTGKCCPLGAIGLARGLPETSILQMYDAKDDPAVKALAEAIDFAERDVVYRIYRFNDDAETTDKDVRKAFKRAIEAVS